MFAIKRNPPIEATSIQISLLHKEIELNQVIFKAELFQGR